MNSKPTYRVATAGLDQRDVRLIDIVFRHSQYNRIQYTLVELRADARADILIINPFEPDGLRTLSRDRGRGGNTPLITAVPAGMRSPAQHSIYIERLTLQLLPILNRLVEQEIESVLRPILRRPGQSSLTKAVNDEAQPGAPERRANPSELAGQSTDGGTQAQTMLRGATSTLGQTTFATTTFASTQFDSTLTRAETITDVATEFGPTIRAVPATPVSILSRELMDVATNSTSNLEQSSARKAPASAALLAFPNTAGSAANPVSVLVVDDSPTVRRQMSLALNRMGLHCVAVDSGAAALEKMSANHFELAMVDVTMQDMDGYQLTRQIRRLYKATPVVILTSRSSPFDLVRGALAGCSTYLVKPVPLKKIEAVVMRQLRKSIAIDDLDGLIRLTAPKTDASPPSTARQGAPRPAAHLPERRASRRR